MAGILITPLNSLTKGVNSISFGETSDLPTIELRYCSTIFDRLTLCVLAYSFAFSMTDSLSFNVNLVSIVHSFFAKITNSRKNLIPTLFIFTTPGS